MFPSRYAEIHVRVYDSSRGLEARASFERPAVTYRLLKSFSIPDRLYADNEYRKLPTFCLVHFRHDFLHNFYHAVRYSTRLLSQDTSRHT